MKAFSLIELMVVIAIVALLAAVAVPQYKSYIIKANTAKVVTTLDALTQRVIQYSAENGIFPSAYDLGLSTTPGQQSVDNPSEFFPAEYFVAANTGVGMMDSSPNNNPCGATGQIFVAIDPYYLGIPEATNPGDSFMYFITFLYNINGMITKYHTFYAFLPNGDTVPGDFVPGWPQYFLDSAATQNQEVLDAIADYEASAVCQ